MTREELKSELRGYTCDRCVLRASGPSTRCCFYYNKRPEENTCCNVTPSRDKEVEGFELISLFEIKDGGPSRRQVENYLKIKERI